MFAFFNAEILWHQFTDWIQPPEYLPALTQEQLKTWFCCFKIIESGFFFTQDTTANVLGQN